MAVELDILPPRYRGPQRIGRGGMGEIYRATDATLGRAVAVKILTDRYAQDESVRERFTREALAAARLSGEPNIVTIFDVGEWNERPFIVMEYLSNGSLDDKLRVEGAQKPQLVLAWLEEAARALDAAHRNGVVHRDVKPANLLLDRVCTVHVADFGIASAAGLDSLTMTGTVLGTAGYLSPEQAQGERSTPASDRYSLGVVAWELLTGSRPFQGDSMTAEAAAHVHAPVPRISERDGNLPHELDAVFERALAKDPDARYPTCMDFVAELRHALLEAAGRTQEFEPAAVAAPPAPPPVGGPRGRRPYAPAPYGRRLLVPALAGIVLLGGGIGVAAAVMKGGGGKTSAGVEHTYVRTVVKTAPGVTVVHRQTVTAATPPATPVTTEALPTTAAKAKPPPSGNGHALNDRGYSLMRAGDYNGALPLLQAAVRALHGVGPSDPYEAYANYNLGYTLVHLGRCGPALAALRRADRLEPGNADVQRAIAQAQSC